MTIKKGDIVKTICGKDKGKTGKVLAVYPKKERALVEGINLMKKHQKRTREDQQGGIVQKESLIHISNLSLIEKKSS